MTKTELKDGLLTALDRAKRARTKDAALLVIQEFVGKELSDKRRRLSPYKEGRIRQLAGKLTPPAIARQMGLSSPTVRKVLAG